MDGIRIASVKANELLRCDTRKQTAGEHVLTVLAREQIVDLGDDLGEQCCLLFLYRAGAGFGQWVEFRGLAMTERQCPLALILEVVVSEDDFRQLDPFAFAAEFQ